MMEVSGGFSLRSILRAILAITLLLGSGATGWVPAGTPSRMPGHESCCCGGPAAVPDPCACPKPEGNRTPSNGLCAVRTIAVAAVAVRRTQAERRTEPRPEPAIWAKAMACRELVGVPTTRHGRDPDLGRHLARLGTFLI